MRQAPLRRARLLGPGATRTARAEKAARVAGLVAAALYTDWLILEPVIGADLPPARSYVSELGARSQPGHVLADALDVVCGLCLLLFCAWFKAVLDADDAPREARAGTYALMGFAAATAVNALVPMTCAPSVQASCPAGGLALHAPVEDLAATALSVVAVVLSLAGMALFAHGLAQVSAWRAVARTCRWLFVAAAPLAVVVGALGVIDIAVGLPQRALIVLQAAWIAALARAPAPRADVHHRAADPSAEDVDQRGARP